MKKFLFLIFLLTYSFSSSAHMAHYNKFNKIEMEILRDGEVIGYNYYFFKKDSDNTTVTNQLKFTVKLLGATIFEVESYGEEKYYKDKLISFNSKTRQNKKDKYVELKLNKKENSYNIKGSSYTGSASVENVVGNWWSHKILQTRSQISPISGSIKEQVVTFIGKEKIELYGKIHEVEHFKLTSRDMSIPKDKRLNFDIWFDKKNSLILKVVYSRMGNWEYKVKKFIGTLSTCIYPDVVDHYPLLETDLHYGLPHVNNIAYGYAKRLMGVHIDVSKKQGLDYSYIIPSNLYGVYESGDITNKHFLGALLDKIKTAIQTGSDFITVLGTGAPLRQFTYAKDVAKIIKLIVDNDVSENMNVGTHENLSIKQMTEMALVATDSTHLRIEWDTSKEDGQYRKDVDCSLLNKNFPNFKFTNFIDGVKETYYRLS